MVVSAAGLELVAVGNEGSSEGPGVGDDLLGVLLPLGRGNLLQCGSNGSNGVVVGATLACGEDSLVYALLEVLCVFTVLAEEDQASARATESLMSERYPMLML